MLLAHVAKLFYVVSEGFDCGDKLMPTYLYYIQYWVTDGIVVLMAIRLEKLFFQHGSAHEHNHGSLCVCAGLSGYFSLNTRKASCQGSAIARKLYAK